MGTIGGIMPAREFTSPESKTAHRHRVLFVDGFPDEAALYSEYFSYASIHSCCGCMPSRRPQFTGSPG